MTHPLLTDRSALERARARTADNPALFLHDSAICEVKDRLAMVNKTFTQPAIITGYSAPWGQAFGKARLIYDDPVLDLKEEAHDLIIHALCLHWADDPVGQLIQCRRALRPDGLFIAVTFAGQTLHELRAVLGQAEIEVTGGLSPRVLPMGELRDLGALLQRAGLALPVADSARLAVTYRNIYHLMHDLRAMGESNSLASRLRQPTRRAVFEHAAELYERSFAVPGGIGASFEMVTLTGWSPDPSQSKPLRPGSASHRLAEALGTIEKPI